MERSYFVLGGDARQEAMETALRARGAAVHRFGLQREDRLTPEVAARLGAADVVLLPLPAADTNGYLNAPAMEKKLPLEMVWSLLRPQQKIFGGMMSESILRAAAEYDLHPLDYYRCEEFVLRNAYITAEGALQLAMERLQRTLRGTPCLILGYGRIGKFLARMLCALRADVTVAARKERDLVLAELEGCETCSLKRLESCLGEMRVIYNTIPHLILDGSMLQRVPKGCLCIDLASKPGGMDPEAAKELGLEAVWAPGLPGKVAPESAGGAVLDTVEQILAEQEVPA